MNMSSTSGNWETLHDFGLLYLAFMHGTDGHIAPSEVTVVGNKMHNWFPDVPSRQIDQVMQEVMLIYMSNTSEQMLETIVLSMRESMSEQQRVKILNDLTEIATADGLIYPGEVTFIEQLAKEWGLEEYLS